MFTSVFLLGNASPRYIRSTMYNIPCNQDMLKESNIPMAMVITPFAKVPEDEVNVILLFLLFKCSCVL